MQPHVILTVATGGLLAAAARTELGLGLEHFKLLAFLAMDPQVISVAADSKSRTFKELVETGRQEPNSLTRAATTGTCTRTGTWAAPNLPHTCTNALSCGSF